MKFISKYFQSQKVGRYATYVVFLYLLFALFFVFRFSSVFDGVRYYTLFDDSMISMRYAKNLANGLGMVWNAGERVEGFSNPLMVWIQAGAIDLFGNRLAVLAVQLFGVVLLAFNASLVLKIVSKFFIGARNSDFWKFLTLLCVLGFYPILYWSISGMESGLMTTLVLLSVWWFEKDREKKISVRLPILLGILALLRMDALAFGFIIIGFRKIIKTEWTVKEFFSRNFRVFLRILFEFSLFMLPTALYEYFRVNYYGEWLPNTYTLKVTGIALMEQLRSGFGFVMPFVFFAFIFLLPVVFWLSVSVFEEDGTFLNILRKKIKGELGMILMYTSVFLAFFVYQIRVGGDPWPPYWRLFAPFVPLLLIASVLSLVRILGLLDVRQSIQKTLGVFFFGVVLMHWLVFYPRELVELKPYQAHPGDYNIATGLVVKEVTSPEARVAALWAGTLQYYSERYGIDPLGKMDKHIARLPADVSGNVSWGGMKSVPGHNKYDLYYTYVLLKPDVIQYIGWCKWGGQDFEDWCKANYEFVSYKGIDFLALKGSDKIKWELLKK
jgi:hypothetical protein